MFYVKITCEGLKGVNQSCTFALFGKENYIWMAIGAVIIAIGMFLMSGGKNQDPKVFDTNVVYSFTRITVAPILILLGFVVEIYAIFKKPKATN